jgi:hypothetical protein
MRSFLFALLLLITTPTWAQFPPQAGVAGSTAIAANDPLFYGWATACTVQRGYRDIVRPDSGLAAVGTDGAATGAPDNSIVSLGDSGVATLQFRLPIRNGEGADFAVFENGFANPVNPEEAYLELAFVEVSSDGVHFVRFGAQFAGDTATQLAGVGTYMNCRTLHNLAGKYRATFGTPFDLSELPADPLLNVNHITHVRIVDVVGSLGASGSRDAQGRKINDPYPTPFTSSGFDLDAVGGIHFDVPAGIAGFASNTELKLFPNPATTKVGVTGFAGEAVYNLYRTDGTAVSAGTLTTGATIEIGHLPAGLYLLQLRLSDGTPWHSTFVK